MNIKATGLNLLLIVSLMIFSSCIGRKRGEQQTVREYTPKQNSLLSNGWEFPDTVENGELGEEYGVKPIIGLQDNYFDIEIGSGYDVAIKIIDASSNRCIRYVFVNENNTATINEIPQGQYYLKIAYGRDWMEKEDSIRLGKFTYNAFYERSRNVFDFGKKNSQGIINYKLSLRVRKGIGENNFKTTPINEQEFYKN